MYDKTKAKVEAVTNSSKSFALTSDCWSSCANQSLCIGVTFHTLTYEWKIESLTFEN